jgi:hypothetical protein
VQVTGSAYREGFEYYKLEFGVGPNPRDDEMSFLVRNDASVQSGVLGDWDVSGLPAGMYTLQLKVIDHTGNWIDPPCRVQVTVGQ